MRVHCLATKRTAYFRRPVSPVACPRTCSEGPLAHAQFLPDARSPQVSAHKNGTRVPTGQPRGCCQPQEAPHGASSRALRLTGPHGPGVAFRHPRSAISVPCPHFGIRHSPAAPHGRIVMGRLIRSTEAAGTHDIAAARATAIGQGLLDFHAPTGLPSRRRPLPRQVLDPNAPSGQRRGHHSHSPTPRG